MKIKIGVKAPPKATEGRPLVVSEMEAAPEFEAPRQLARPVVSVSTAPVQLSHPLASSTDVPLSLDAEYIQIEQIQDFSAEPIEAPSRFSRVAAFINQYQFEPRHLIPAAGILFVLFAIVPRLFPSAMTTPPGIEAPKGRGISATALMGKEGMDRYRLPRRNPEVSWLERAFCVGAVKSLGCGNTAYHPYVTWWKNFGDSDTVDPQTRGRAAKTILTTFKKGPSQNPYEHRKVALQPEG